MIGGDSNVKMVRKKTETKKKTQEKKKNNNGPK